MKRDRHTLVDIKPDNILVNYDTELSRFTNQLADFGDLTRVDPKEYLKVGNRLIWGLNWHLFKPDPEDATTDDEEYLIHNIIRNLAHFGPVPKSCIDLIPREDGDRWSILASATQYIKDNHKQRPFKLIKDECLTEEAKEFLLKVVKLDPRDRPTARQLLQDKWFSDVP
ncbi:hypothetical protein D0Z07_3648 [Hyphodiscus hymeniophilus]|uniref:Protein kinase domain-containing protein n=1 Tax=Hyphodiscus hymeniophilus TaxID=353542 RepID=A0A9P6VK28_9HELO|nr:hypothetical protein D0Z07_3648 [Hyphodiscus hymeniophilus]